MRDIPINVPVKCSDGLAGETTKLIVDPINLVVTHIVVLDNSFPPVERLVAVENIQETSLDSSTAGDPRQARLAGLSL